MKAQASLEMVVGLIILLVVAGVVISLVIHYISPKNMPNAGDAIKKNQFLQNCEDYCKDTNSVDYCRYYWGSEARESGSVTHLDWNGDGEVNGIVNMGKFQWAICEDRIFCFLAVPCDRFGSGGLDTLEKCKRMLCQTYKEKYGDDVKATNALKDAVDVEPCDMISVDDDDNWYAKVFEDAEC